MLHSCLSPRLLAITKIEKQECLSALQVTGKMLDELLDEAGIERDEIYMTNLIKCRLPKNRRPKQNEIKACSSFLEKEIALIDPEVFVPLGYYSTRNVLKRYNIAIPESRAEFSGLYGKLFVAQHKRLYPLPHPAALLYNKSYKPVAFEKYGKLRVLLETSKSSARPL